jgi:D-alanyl-lipoteichoic acid acyltransferase DltB (MBOAT superfamily)
MNWNPLYGLLILFSTLVTWLCALLMNQKSRRGKKKIILFFALIINLGILFVFKYANFLTTNINDLFHILNIHWEVSFPDLLLPVGISFYTFQAIGYTIDVYRGNIPAEKNFITYALFVSFFPQLVAGPIERAKNLLPQFKRVHYFDPANFVQGARLILWGYFMKVVVADRLAIYVDVVYGNLTVLSGLTLIVAAIFFAFQIYCDFGGYSNIAIGCAKIMGFDLMTNFRRPYLSVSVTEFWRRWHISLSTWFRDYVYIPLGGNRCSKGRNYLNLLITFTVSGLWHGANWTFIIWGALNGILQIMEKMTADFRKKLALFLRLSKIPAITYGFKLLFVFVIITITWVFFRAYNLDVALFVLKKMWNPEGPLLTMTLQALLYGSCFTVVLLVSDFLQERNDDKHFFLENRRAWVRYITYFTLVIVILLFGVFDSSRFIYFQF